MIFASQVGQMLTNLRVSTNNMLLPFTAQILALLQDTASQKEMGEWAYCTQHACVPLLFAHIGQVAMLLSCVDVGSLKA